VIVQSLPLRSPVVSVPLGVTMAEYDQDHQVAVPGPEPVSSLAFRRRPGARIPVLYAVRAGSLGWMSYGACRSEDPELFFPISASGPALRQIRSAKAVCARCPVQANCLSYALITGQDDGIWGGTTREERWPTRRPRHGPPPELAGPR